VWGDRLMVPPVFVALGLAAPLLAFMGLISALGEWATEALGKARGRSSTAPSPAGVPGLQPSPASGSPSGGVPVTGGRPEPEPA
jgi:hypothetical protein